MSMKCIVDVRSMKQQTLSSQRMILAEESWYSIMGDFITVFRGNEMVQKYFSDVKSDYASQTLQAN